MFDGGEPDLWQTAAVVGLQKLLGVSFQERKYFGASNNAKTHLTQITEDLDMNKA